MRGDTVELAYIIHSAARGYLAAGCDPTGDVLQWADHHCGARPYSKQDETDLAWLHEQHGVTDAKFIGPYFLDAWGNVAEAQQ